MATGKTGNEPFKVPAVEVEGTAGNGLVAFWQELATADVEGVGKVTIGNSAMGGLGLFCFLPQAEGATPFHGPPTTYIVDLGPLVQAMIGAAVERYKTGEPGVFYRNPVEMENEEIWAELDRLEKMPTKPGSGLDKERGARIAELRKELAE